MSEQKPQGKGRTTPKAPQNKSNVTQVAADRQRAQARQAILNEADALIADTYQEALRRMDDDVAESIVYDLLMPALDEAANMRRLAERFAPIKRAS